MNLSIPIYVEEHKIRDDPHPQFRLRPLFFPSPAKVGRQIATAMSKLAQAVRGELDALGREPRQERLIPWTFAPPLIETNLKLTLRLRRQTAECRFLVVAFEAFDRRLAFTPAIPELFFEVLRGQDLAARAREVITDHFRRIERDEGDDFELPASLASFSRAWLTTLDLDVHPKPTLKAATDANALVALFSNKAADGRAELGRVGRCLDWLYPDGLDRVVLRDAEADELTRLLAEPQRRPILLLGPRGVGKTALVHECVYRRIAQRGATGSSATPPASDHMVWLLSPARLIAGMSYVGQWEERLLAILDEAAARQHVLYFEDVLGLYQAGQSADSDLNVAAVLRPWVERRAFRLLAEMTPEGFRVLNERDRGLADLFHVLPLREPSEPESRRILIHVTRQLEDRHRCRFDTEALPTVIELERRYVRDQAMPGKAATFVGQLALKHAAQAIDRQTVLSEFGARSGLAMPMLDGGVRLSRREIVAALAQDIVGQREALSAMADVVAVAKARLNDPGRPQGTLLFLGPTGVGKTAAAKALAKYLYGDADRLLRFDMNEYVEPSSVARLTGTFGQPDGALTAAVRRQPFCVVLLDEIEKAHPAVFDLLLQVLGEGRLTDAVGRVSDFTSAVIVMTSNLGSREAGTSFGLRPANAPRDEVYREAARRFFRPEFFNRIDRIVPFAALERTQVAEIATRLMADLLRREGLVHRRCVLTVDPAAMEWIVAQGYHPELGARALKRAVERQLTAPIAATLASVTPAALMIIAVHTAADGIAAEVRTLTNAQPSPRIAAAADVYEVDAVLDRVEAFVNDVEGRNRADEAQSARLSTDALSPAHFRYFAVREQIRQIDQMIRRIDQAGARPPSSHVMGRKRTARVRPARRVRQLPPDLSWPAEGDLHAFLVEHADTAVALGDSESDRLVELLQECALLAAMAGGAGDRVLLEIRPLAAGPDWITKDLAHGYQHLFAKQFSFSSMRLDVEDSGCAWLLIEMPGAAAILANQSGTHLFYPPGENVLPVRLGVFPLADEDDPTLCAAARARMGTAGAPLSPVTRLHDPTLATLDLPTRLVCPNLPLSDDLRRFVMAGLELPPALVSGES